MYYLLPYVLLNYYIIYVHNYDLFTVKLQITN